MALALIILTISMLVATLLIVFGVQSHRKKMAASEAYLSDRELLLLINSEPDRIINAANLARKSRLSLGQARTRLHRLMYAGAVNQMTSGFKYFYELRVPIEKKNLVALSDQPFISIEDLFTLFDHYGHKMTLQDICIATGLPFKVIKEEMKYFQKEGVVHQMTQHVGVGLLAQKFYTLQDAYKDHQAQEGREMRDKAMNLDLEKLYQRVRRGDDGYV